MVYNSKIIGLTLFTFSIIALLLILSRISLACHLEAGTYYASCSPSSPDCKTSGSVTAYDWKLDFGGCEMGFAAGQYYSLIYYHNGVRDCECLGPEAKWRKSGSLGETCKVRSGAFCEVIGEGVWDGSSCVRCERGKKVKKISCSGISDITPICASVCGSYSECDGKTPGTSLPDICGSTVLEVNRKCDSDCKISSTTYLCDSNHAGESKSCGGQTYYCVYDNGWKWSTSKPSGFCCGPDDCPGYDPNTHLKLICDSNTHTCIPKGTCEGGDDCERGWCCDTVTAAKDCKAKGTILSYEGKSYLCDPPEGFVEAKNKAEKSTKSLSLLDMIINFFSQLLNK